jgi:hypothetical protein
VDESVFADLQVYGQPSSRLALTFSALLGGRKVRNGAREVIACDLWNEARDGCRPSLLHRRS